MLTLSHIQKRYLLDDVVCHALRGVSVTFSKGQSTAIVGSSGSGKSTLLHVAALIDEPHAGEIFFEGQNISVLNDAGRTAFRRDHFGFVFQGYHLIPVLSCLENVLLPYNLKGTGNKETGRNRAKLLLESVGLKEHIYKNIRALSGGQRQRVAVARALMNQPKVLFADEPTANLDSATGRMVLTMLTDLCRSQETTLVMCTHDPTLLHFVDAVVTLADGLVINEGTSPCSQHSSKWPSSTSPATVNARR